MLQINLEVLQVLGQKEGTRNCQNPDNFDLILLDHSTKYMNTLKQEIISTSLNYHNFQICILCIENNAKYKEIKKRVTSQIPILFLYFTTL